MFREKSALKFNGLAFNFLLEWQHLPDLANSFLPFNYYTEVVITMRFKHSFGGLLYSPCWI